ncbi:MAG: HAMP domain-containing protein, partial [Candidatus Tectomicrobia bacterium]
MLDKLTIRRKFYTLFGVILLIFIASGIIDYLKLEESKDNWKRYLSEVAVRQGYLMEVEEAFGYGSGIHNFKNFVLRGTPKYADRFAANYEEIIAVIERYAALPGLSEREKAALVDIRKVADAYKEALATAQDMHQKGNSAVIIDGTITIDDSPALNGFDVLREEHTQLTAQRSEMMSAAIQGALFAVVASLLVALCVILVFSLFISGGITRPLLRMNEAAKSLAEGDLSAKVEVSTSDEIGQLGQSFNGMVGNLKQLMDEVQAEKAGVEQKVEAAVRESEAQQQYLSRSVDRMLNEMDRFAEGDLTVRLEVERTDDEIGQLYSGFNRAVSNIRGLFEQVRQAVASTV